MASPASIAAVVLPDSASAAIKVPLAGKEHLGHHGMIYRSHGKLVKSPDHQMHDEGSKRRDADRP